MPSVSKSQQRLMAAAEHGADFPMADKLRQTMSHEQLHDFAAGPMTGKPEHILKGESTDVLGQNVQSFKNAGQSEFEATRSAIKAARKANPHAHKNLGKFLHQRKDGKPHGSGKD